MPSAAFRVQNEFGTTAEKLIANAFLESKWAVCLPQVGSRWDLTVTLNNVSEHIEIKNEEKYATSGNICVEYYQGEGSRKRWSGIVITESTFFIHFFGDTSLVMRTQPFRMFLHEYGNAGAKLQPFSAADNANGGLIIPRNKIVGAAWAREVELKQIPHAVAFLRQEK